MNALFKKLNRGSHDVRVERSVAGACAFAMAFVITRAQLDAASRTFEAACGGDAILWMVYPKGTSKKYQCEFNRDCGWPILAAAGFEPVRMVATDADWSALRFRRRDFIKTMTRSTK